MLDDTYIFYITINFHSIFKNYYWRTSLQDFPTKFYHNFFFQQLPIIMKEFVYMHILHTSKRCLTFWPSFHSFSSMTSLISIVNLQLVYRIGQIFFFKITLSEYYSKSTLHKSFELHFCCDHKAAVKCNHPFIKWKVHTFSLSSSLPYQNLLI